MISGAPHARAHAMKIACERCSAQYDLDENRIPPAGMTMKCPACLHTFVVRRDGIAVPPPPASPPERPREIELSAVDEEPASQAPTAPGLAIQRVGATTFTPDEIDLPAPVNKQRAVVDLPAPKAGPRSPAIPPPRPPTLPRHSPDTLRDQPIALSRPSPDPDEIDLPAPVDPNKHRDEIDLPAPKRAQPRLAHLDDEPPDLLAPKGRAPQVGISLDAPDPDDLIDGTDGGYGGPPGLELDAIDVVAPKKHDSAELPTPKIETTDVTPKPPPTDIAPKLQLRGPREPPPDFRPTAAPLPPKAPPEAEAEEKPRRRRGLLLVIAGVTVVLGGVGVALGVFTDFGAQLFHRGPSAVVEQQMNNARTLMGEDTLPGYRKASASLEALVTADPKLTEAEALAAQVHLRMARLGVSAEIKRADTLLGQLGDEKTAQLPDVQPDVQKARALRSLVGGNYNDARTKLNAILQKAPADAIALITLGWTELGAGDAAAADKAFTKALAAEGTRAAALFADGLAKERLGDGKGALDLYARALSRSPQHFGAAVAVARLSQPPADAQAQIEALVKERASNAGPRELADAWAALGTLALQSSRRDEAEDRLKRALQLDPDLAAARVSLAQVQCDLKHCSEAIAPLQKLVAAQPKNLGARLGLVRAQLETNAVTEAQATLAPALKDAPKDANVLYWQARALLAQPRPDREQAIARLKEATAANAKFIPAYVALSNALAGLGQSDEAVAALQKAQDQASDAPDLMLELGEAYLGLNRPGEAEQRFRAALGKKPELTAARMDLGLALEAQNKLAEAKAEYDKIDAKYPGVTERQARLAVKQGRKSDAAALFTQALSEGTPTAALRLAAGTLDLDPAVGPKLDEARKLAESVLAEDERSALGHLLLAQAEFAQGKVEDALPEARRAATLADIPEAHYLLGRVLEQLAKLDQAINEYNLARRAPVEGDASLGRARILVRMGATKDALAELTALARDPKLRAPALLLTGDCYADLQQADRARHAYQDAVKAAPDSGDAAFKLGRALHDAGRRHDTITQVERALKLGGDKAAWASEAYLLLGDAHREGKENAAAVKAYQRYLELAPADAPARKEVERNVSLLGGS
jgi:predicted Zn finger-like uncharacterized protein